MIQQICKQYIYSRAALPTTETELTTVQSIQIFVNPDITKNWDKLFFIVPTWPLSQGVTYDLKIFKCLIAS